MLVAESTKRGETLAALAKHLGVTYQRLAQWRRNDANIATAQRKVHVKAAKYLGLPTVLVLAMAGTIQLEEFVWPDKEPLRDRVNRDLECLRQDPHLGGFAPPELALCTPAVKLFVAFLYREMVGHPTPERRSYQWASDLRKAMQPDPRSTPELENRFEKALSRALF